jgi:hypothetical protein
MRSRLLALGLLTLIPALSGVGLGSDRFHHGRRASSAPDLDSLFAAATPLEKSAEAQSLIEDCMERYGGRRKLGNLKSYRLYYRMKSLMNPESLDVVKSFQAGRRYRIDRHGGRIHEARILSRDQSWYQNLDTLICMTHGSRHRAELFSYLSLAMPLAIETEGFEEIRYGLRRDRPYAYIYMDKPGSLMVCLGIDPIDHTIRSIDGLIRHSGSTSVFEHRFDDLRYHDGYLFPHRVTNVSMGLEVGRSVLKDVDVNPDLGEDYFAPAPRSVTGSSLKKKKATGTF